MSETFRQILAKRAALLRKNMTVYEKKIWYNFLYSYEMPFRPQKVIGNYIVDFYCRRAHLSIEIDGDSHFNEKAVKYDNTRTLFLEIREIKELRFTNSEIRENFEGVCEIIDREVKKRRNDLFYSSLDVLRAKK